MSGQLFLNEMNFDVYTIWRAWLS